MIETSETFVVVVNEEEQYSIWPSHREIPLGWRDAGVRGSKDTCLAHITEVWTDMRPLSLRRQMEEWERNPPPPPEPLPLDDAPPLVERLAGDDHRVEVRTRAEDRVAYLRERLEIGYLHVHFPETRGGTELGLKLDLESCRAAKEALSQGGEIALSGSLSLDETPVCCNVRLSVPELVGRGGLTVSAK